MYMATKEEKLANDRREMVQRHLRGRGITDERILEAFAWVPREVFLPPDRWVEAYADHPIPIGFGQTVSQPYLIALMLQELAPRPGQHILDVGLGSGYQTAILAQVVGHVYAVERIEELTERALGALGKLDVNNVTVCTADGSLGWPEEAPFDGIICGAAAPTLPHPWVTQLLDGGRIVLPIGGPDQQVLAVFTRHGSEMRRRDICEVRFVKLVGKEGWQEEEVLIGSRRIRVPASPKE